MSPTRVKVSASPGGPPTSGILRLDQPAQCCGLRRQLLRSGRGWPEGGSSSSPRAGLRASRLPPRLAPRPAVMGSGLADSLRTRPAPLAAICRSGGTSSRARSTPRLASQGVQGLHQNYVAQRGVRPSEVHECASPGARGEVPGPGPEERLGRAQVRRRPSPAARSPWPRASWPLAVATEVRGWQGDKLGRGRRQHDRDEERLDHRQAGAVAAGGVAATARSARPERRGPSA